MDLFLGCCESLGASLFVLPNELLHLTRVLCVAACEISSSRIKERIRAMLKLDVAIEGAGAPRDASQHAS